METVQRELRPYLPKNWIVYQDDTGGHFDGWWWFSSDWGFSLIGPETLTEGQAIDKALRIMAEWRKEWNDG